MRPHSPLSSILWGLYLACSWTWCIGLLLPHILLDRFGWPGFLAFAAVNVVGATALGFVLATARRSQDMVRTHGGAMRWFSTATLAFHLFFVAYLCHYYGPAETRSIAMALLIPLGAYIAALALSFVPLRLWPWMALLVYALSIGTFVRIGAGTLGDIAWRGDSPPIDVLWIAPMMAMGFLLCPYLDLTFHRALQESGGRGAFVVFAPAFAAMLFLTAAYWDFPHDQAERFVIAHIAAQTLFTMGAHLRELRGGRGGRAPGGAARLGALWMLALPLLALPIIPIVASIEDAATVARDTYLRFLVFYGLLFPAYVLLLMTRSYQRPTARSVQTVLLLAIVLAPLYEAGFIHAQAWLLLIPVGVLLVVRAMRA